MYPLIPFSRRISSIVANGSPPGAYLVAIDQSVSPDLVTTVGTGPAGSAAWLAGSRVSTWRELYSWYNPAVGFQSAALPVGFEDLVDRIKPTVVGVRAKVEQDADDEDRPSGRDAPSTRSDVPMGRRGTSQPRTATTLGSGFFISSDGYAMTTNHLIEHSEKIEVTTDDGKTYAAKLVGADPKTDLALLKIDGGTDFAVAPMADKAPRIVYGTYLGGSHKDGAAAIAVDSFGNAYVVGVTFSTNFPVKNAFQAVNRSGGVAASNAFAASSYSPFSRRVTNARARASSVSGSAPGRASSRRTATFMDGSFL